MYPCATMAPVNGSSCDVADPPPETHCLRGRAEDGMGEALVRHDGPRGHAPGRPDGWRGGACGARVCGLATGGGHPSLSFVSLLPALPLPLALSSLSRLPPVSSLLWLASLRPPVVSACVSGGDTAW